MTTIRTINKTGVGEIRTFLAANHKRGSSFTRDQIAAWVDDAEFQLAEGNTPSIEIPAHDSVRGCTVTYTVSDAGVDSIEQVFLHGHPVAFDAAVNLMDDEIRERLNTEMAPCSDQELLDAYVEAHAEKFDGEEFSVE